MDTQDLIDQQQEAVDKFFEQRPEGTVLVIGNYSPNGGQPVWEYYVPYEQGEQPELVAEDGEEIWDTVELNDRNELRLSRTPAKGVHRYRSYQWEPAAGWAENLIDTYGGSDGFWWKDISDFGDWLQEECDLEAKSEGFAEVMRAALELAKERL